MPLILSIESSTSVCSAAVHRDGALLQSQLIETPNSAAGQLAVLIDQVIKQSGATISELDAVAVSAGPGSYTGLRIGVATAKGLCYTLNKPLIAINSLEVMAHAVKALVGDGLLCPMIDARRMEVYTMLFDRELKVLEETSAKVIEDGAFGSWLQSNPIAFFGNGSSKCREVIHHPNAVFIDGIIPRAEDMGTLAAARFVKGQFEDVSSYEPFYLKDFVAKQPRTLA